MAKPRKRRAKATGKSARAAFWGQRWGRLASAFLSALLLGAVVLAGGVYWLSRDLPSLDAVAAAPGPQPIEIFARDGQTLLARYGQVRGDALPFDAIPPVMVQAILAIEDRRFFDHPGIDWRGIARAAWANLAEGRVVEGGSTLSQQLAKNLFLNPERTLVRKVKEAMLAFALERRFSKQELVALYLNRVYFGGGAYGIDAASRLYFDHSARTLTIHEAALLAGLVKAPSRLAPTNNANAAQARAATVLAAMADAGYLSAEEAADLSARPAKLVLRGTALENRYFTDWVVAEARESGGDRAQPLSILTTLDPKVQAAAGAALARHVPPGRMPGLEAALIALAPDGGVLAMVGGRDYAASVFNRAVQARRQPGSAFKLFVYLAALEAGLAPYETMRDSPVILDGWAPRNDWNGFSGEEISLADAFARSVNTVAVKVAERVNRQRVIAIAARLGISTPITPHPSVALGTSEVSLAELSAAYATVAHGGLRVTPHGIREIRDGNGRLLNRYGAWGGEALLRRETAALMTAMLERVIAQGTGRAANPGRPAAGKTGTSQDNRDGWFIGFTADMTAGVWLGRDDARPVPGLSGGALPARLWADFIARASKGLAIQPLPSASLEPPLLVAEDRVQEALPQTAGEPPPPQKKRSFWDRLFGRKRTAQGSR
ncbi:MAG: transglycosylase domain-containing protein [Pseudomonadota bacterium]